MDLMLILPIVAVLVIGCAALVVLGLRSQGEVISIEERLAAFAENPTSLEEIELSLPFRQRVLGPFFFKLGTFFGRFMPHKNLEKLRQNLIEAGNPSKLGPVEFMGVKAWPRCDSRRAFFFSFSFLLVPSQSHSWFQLVLPESVTSCPGSGWAGKSKQRKQEIQNALADADDLLSISVEAGAGSDPALARVINKWDNALTDEFKRMLGEMQMGKSRRGDARDAKTRVSVGQISTSSYLHSSGGSSSA
ncbi:MAG: type II secretion system F family protein [Thermomicrobiales bacterium]